MQPSEPIQRVRIYLSERDVTTGQPLYLAALDLLRSSGATGATVLRGVAGFGPSQQLRVDQTDTSQSLPILIEWIDRAERVARILPSLDTLLPNALITIEDVRVYRAVLRSSGPFGDRVVGDVAARDVATVPLQSSVGSAIVVMIERAQPLLPVLDGDGWLAGVISSADLQRRGLPSLELLQALDEDGRAAALAPLAGRPLTEILTTDQRVLNEEASILHAASTMIEWGIELMLVTARDGRFRGLFGIDQVLQATIDARPSTSDAVRPAEAPTPVRLLMQSGVTTVTAQSPASAVLTQLLADQRRHTVVLDAGQPVGSLSALELLARLTEPRKSVWLAALQSPATATQAMLDEIGAGRTAAALSLTPAQLIEANTPRDTAIALLLEHNLDQLAVVDERGKLLGVVSRHGILRALVQESST